MLATEKMLDVVKTLLDEEQPEALFPKILDVAKDVLHADAAVLDIGGEEPLHFSNPEKVSISISAVKLAKNEKRAVVWNQLDDESADLSKSIVQNQLTSIMVSPFRTPDSEAGYLYLQRAARKEPFTEEDSALFDSFVAVCEKFAFAAYDRLRDKESLDALKNVVRKDGIVYSSKAMVDVVAMADKLSPLPLPVIIRGETGTGKEVMARYIHKHSPRAEKPFIAVNCGAIPEHLMESLMFGHAKACEKKDVEGAKAALKVALRLIDKSVSAGVYTRNTEEGWSRSRLEDQVAANLFGSQGAAVTNFEHTLPTPQSQLAKEILKDPYHFEFLSMAEEYEEKDMEDALVSNVTRFLMELGKGFSYVGRQMELQMPGGQTFFPDLLFYNIPQHRYVVIELKVVKYIPEFAGKLNFDVTAVDELLRGEGDNPTVGLIICKSTDKTVVEWSLRDINKPLGVSSYQLEEVVERTVKELEMRKSENKRK